MLTKEKILELAKAGEKILTSSIAASFGLSRQYVSQLIASLVEEDKLIKIGSTRKAFYILPEYAKNYAQTPQFQYIKVYKNAHLEEHKILEEIQQKIPLWQKLPENIYSIFSYAFSEMLNNAIEHSESKSIKLELLLHDHTLSFVIDDSGIGVFKSVMHKKQLASELEAIGELLKGKVTTMPKSHSGEGIFFTARAGDEFILDSYGYQLIFDNKLPDVFINQSQKKKKGTKVIFKIAINSTRHLKTVFDEYANLTEESDYGFDKTEIRVKLYTISGIHVSRSQARRILSGLEKFRVILFDYDKISMVGQAFADEIYRVFHNKYPEIKIEEINMNDTVKFMIERSKNESLRKKEF
ncbi:MAG: hypothetical protein A2X78_00420 [Gammaproteobacteria bacterium GWE2_37_16]|nr:MAG: hypothetical protein A2X78_00420 [Gammaproteobacteria bacterium GWE2_37_16]